MRKSIPNIAMPNYSREAKDIKNRELSPFEVLNKAASQLSEQTQALVQAEVFLAPFLGTIRYTFYLVIPTLNNYTDPLFYVWTSQPDRGYPVFLLESGAEQRDQQQCDDAQKLISRLEQIFSSSWAKSRISQWIEMAEERIAVRR